MKGNRKVFVATADITLWNQSGKILSITGNFVLMRNDSLNEVMEEVMSFSMAVLERGIHFGS